MVAMVDGIRYVIVEGGCHSCLPVSRVRTRSQQLNFSYGN